MYTLVPYRRLLKTQNELMNRFFDSSFPSPSLNNSFRVDIRESEKAYTLEAELPGMAEENINLSVNNDMLTISADSVSEQKQEKEHSYYCERRFGHVERSFSLEGIQQDSITAEYVNGLLTVTLPKSQPEPVKGARKIAINAPKLEGEAPLQ